MKHGEQLAPLIEAVLADAGVVRQDLTAIAVGVGPGPVHRAARRAGHRAHAGLRARAPGVRRVLARRARGRGRARAGVDRDRLRGRHRRPPQGGLPRVVRRRRGAASTVPTCVDSPADVATDRAGGRRGRGALPRRPSRDARRPRAAERRLAGPRGRRGAAPSCATPSRSTCAAPTRRSRGARRGCRDRDAGRARPAGPTTPAAVAALERDGARLRRVVGRAWSPRAWRGGSRPTLYLVAERGRRASSATRRSASSPTSPSCSGSRWRRPTVVPAWPPACSPRVEHEALTRHADRLLLEVREDNHVALRVLRRPGLHRDRPAPALLRRRHRPR